MYESNRSRACVSLSMGRKPGFHIVHTLLSLVLCLSVACGRRREAGVLCPAIEIDAVANTQTDSTRTVSLNDTTLLISRTPLVATSDITGVTATKGEDQWALHFTVSDDAAARVHEFSRQHVGSRLALVVDGKIHGTPRIASAIVGNGYGIEGFDHEDAERVATAISDGCHR